MTDAQRADAWRIEFERRVKRLEQEVAVIKRDLASAAKQRLDDES